ncbi:hypothetical protein PS15m_007116 [Mucor circinelloides]
MPWSALKCLKGSWAFYFILYMNALVSSKMPQGLLGSLLLLYTWSLFKLLQYFHDLFLVLLTLVNCAMPKSHICGNTFVGMSRVTAS